MTVGSRYLGSVIGFWAIAIGTEASCQLRAQSLSSVAKNQAKEVQTITFLLSSRRIMPEAIEISEGQYYIRLRNGESTKPVDFTVKDLDKGRQGKAVTAGNRVHPAAFFDLDAGNYEISIDQNPAWKAKITVVKANGNGK
jgi:hypothetical protein